MNTNLQPAVGFRTGDRSGVLLPFGSAVKVATAVVTVMLCILAVVLWGVTVIWHELSWAVTIATVAWWCRKLVRAYREGRNN